jgi:hypothetical protein
VTRNGDRSLTRDLARIIVKTVAPDECVVFSVLSEVYFAPGGRGREDEELGFGGAEAVALLTPVVMAAADSVTQELVSDLIHEKVVCGISEAREAVRRLFRLGQRGDGGETEEPGEPLSQLTTAEWAKLHRIAKEAVRREGGTPEDAERVANALVVIGQGVLGQEQP